MITRRAIKFHRWIEGFALVNCSSQLITVTPFDAYQLGSPHCPYNEKYSNHIVCPSVCSSTLSLCCDNWNTFVVTKNFQTWPGCLSGQDLGQVRIWVIWGLSVRPSVCPHFLYDGIIGILFYRELSIML